MSCDNNSVECDDCSWWFCSFSLLFGLPALIMGIQEYGGDGIVFICTGWGKAGSDGRVQ